MSRKVMRHINRERNGSIYSRVTESDRLSALDRYDERGGSHKNQEVELRLARSI